MRTHIRSRGGGHRSGNECVPSKLEQGCSRDPMISMGLLGHDHIAGVRLCHEHSAARWDT